MARTARPNETALLDEVSRGLAGFGLAASSARVLAWLLLSPEPRQTAAQLRAATGLSAGAVSQATTTLCSAGLLARGRVDGGRASWYEAEPDAWIQTIRTRYAGVHAARAQVDGWLVALGGAGSPRAARLAGMADMLEAMLDAEQYLLERLEARRVRKPSG